MVFIPNATRRGPGQTKGVQGGPSSSSTSCPSPGLSLFSDLWEPQDSPGLRFLPLGETCLGVNSFWRGWARVWCRTKGSVPGGRAGTRHRYWEAEKAPWVGSHISDHVYVLALPSSTPLPIVVFKSQTHPRIRDHHTSGSTRGIKNTRKNQQ